MSVWSRSSFDEGFPLTPTRLHPTGAVLARVTAPEFQDDGSSPRPWAAPVRTMAPRRPAAMAHTPLRLGPVGALMRAPGTLTHRPRTRAEHHLIWITKGHMLLNFPRQRMDLAPGDLCFIPAGTAFAPQPLDGEGHALTLQPSLAMGIDPPLPSTVTWGSVGAAADALRLNLQELAAEVAAGSPAQAVACQLTLLSLRLARLATPRVPPQPPSMAMDGNRPLVDRFLDLAADQLTQNRTLAEHAQDLGATLAQLDRACMETRGCRALALVQQLRVERAAQLLQQTTLPSARVARDLGYASLAHFTRAFVTATGRTPEAYRQQLPPGAAPIEGGPGGRRLPPAIAGRNQSA